MSQQPPEVMSRDGFGGSSRPNGRDAATMYASEVSLGPAPTSDIDQVAAALTPVGSAATTTAAGSWQPSRQQQWQNSNGEGGSGGSSGIAATAAASGGGGGGGEGRRGIVGGLMDWALWPLWGTVDTVKWAGASVNEVAVAPVMRYAGPAAIAEILWDRFVKWTPQRARDIGRIYKNGAINVAKIWKTAEGAEVLRSASAASSSLAMAVSSPAGRQFVMDSATGLVKVAEAMNTPEFKNVLQQGAVVMARAVDAMATQHTKLFLQDAANTAARLLELANSSEAMDMTAELTADVYHALEMEHISGERNDPRFAVSHPASIVSPDGDVSDSYSFTLERGRAALASGTLGGQATSTAAAAAVSTAGDAVAGAHRSRSDSSARGSVWSGNTDRTSRAMAAEVRTHPTPITQADLYRNRGLRMSSPEFAAAIASSTLSPHPSPAAASPLPPAPGTPSSGDGVGIGLARSGSAAASSNVVGRSGAETGGWSTPSTPVGRHDWSGANSAPAVIHDGAPVASAGGGRPRSNSDSMVGDRVGRAPDALVVRQNAVGSENEVAVAGVGVDVSADDPDSPGAPVGYRRDGPHVMPKHSMRTFLPILRGAPVELERQLSPPTLRTVERTLHDAARRYQEVGGDDRSPTETRGRTGAASGVVSDDVADSSGAQADSDIDRSDVDGNRASPRSAGSWLQKVVVTIVFLLALDGLRHELFGTRRATPPRRTSATRSSFSTRAAGSKGVLRRPTCQDPETGATMLIWATPSGVCLSLDEEESGDAEVWGGVSPACGAEFRLCATRETARVTRSGEDEISGDPVWAREKEVAASLCDATF